MKSRKNFVHSHLKWDHLCLSIKGFECPSFQGSSGGHGTKASIHYFIAGHPRKCQDHHK